ncbi:MAG: aspartate aminotransferase family protein [Alphaproteobacteria bacterium]|nr:aspartate aminotransferase family protein [Alphaproteobacteria bacterium]
MNAVMQTYGRVPIAFERGEGAYLISTDGERYLDGAGGIAVVSMGHSHPQLVAALTEQAQRLWHVSNLYEIPEQSRYAERLTAACFADAAFFCNSGAEAMEGAIKLARKYHAVNGAGERYRAVTLEGSFHGRTLATLGAAQNPKHLDGFGPPADGFDIVPPNNLNALRAAIGPQTAAIIAEPLQGEGGIRPLENEYFQALRATADEFGVLLVLDEIQTGFGRTGKLFAHEWAGITPDIMACAKGIAGGFPCGAVLATERVAAAMSPGTHGSTFGGNPLAMAVANATLDILLEDGFLADVERIGALLGDGLVALTERYPEIIESVRGSGLMLGLVVRAPHTNGDLGNRAREHGLLTVVAGENVLRLLPPLIIREPEVEVVLAALDSACAALKSNGDG